MSDDSHAYWVILVSFLSAVLLAILPIDRSLAWWRPEWVLLTLVYWTIALPHRVGLITAMAMGFLIPTEVKVFSCEHLDAARDWITG